MPPRLLTPADVDVWLWRPDWAEDPATLEAEAVILSPAEHARRTTFAAREAHDAFVAGRILLRTTLSRYVPRAPVRWELVLGEHGRPFLAPGQTDLDIRFNLSHTRGLIACVVALGKDVGIDAEWTGRDVSASALADRYFAPAEADALGALAPPARRHRFYRYWTLKESYVKARGEGLRTFPSAISFDVDDATEVRATSQPPDEAARWRFWSWDPTPDHALAVAVAASPDPSLGLRITSVPPGLDSGRES